MDECTGLAATWCPVCGDCACSEEDRALGNLDDPNCPLHAPNSPHAEIDPEREAARELWKVLVDQGVDESDFEAWDNARLMTVATVRIKRLEADK